MKRVHVECKEVALFHGSYADDVSPQVWNDGHNQHMKALKSAKQNQRAELFEEYNKRAGIQKTPNEPQLEFILACKDLVAPVRDRKLNTLVQISVIQPSEQGLTRYSSTEIVEGTRDPLFLTGVTFPSEYPIYEETKIKLTVYDVKDKSHDTADAEANIWFRAEMEKNLFSHHVTHSVVTSRRQE
ncbi:Type II inositol-3,4-bisphosphate 4-phosphatase [Myotis brandtii]|uniref:Type II inositol-3,4-bisphosphate 4-phosphatase n=1 Tax=Myotis brandtii TaxID=109478 RepID=S7Q6C1_MYOBR|nr:Type II inositol-3,4-bisphosphate 4-phosphatase [Myotis brandtii]